MANLFQKGQFINEPGRTYLDALANPPQGAVDALDWSIAEAQEIGTDVGNPDVTEVTTYTDRFRENSDNQAMGSYGPSD